MKALCIVNPSAGQGKALTKWQSIEDKVKEMLPGLIVKYTKGPGHAIDIAKSAVKGNYQLLIIVGGDGTINEAVNGMIGGNLKLAIIPAGTGNDLAKTLDIPEEPIKAADLIRYGKIKKIDVGLIDNKYFINMAGFGFDASVANKVNRKRILRGNLAYLYAILQTIFDYTAVKTIIEIDGKEYNENVTLVSIGNGAFIGGGVKMLPYAVIDDGLMDICVVKYTSKITILKSLPLLYKGNHINLSQCQFLKGKKVIIKKCEANSNIYAQYDGQILQNIPKVFSIVPKALDVFVPIL